MTACVRKMEVDIHPMEPHNSEARGQLAPYSSSPVSSKPLNTVAIPNAVGPMILYIFHIVSGKRQYVPTDQLLVMALHHCVLNREHSASIAHIPKIITQKGH